MLLCLLLFNFCGYKLMLYVLQDQADDRTEQVLDAGHYTERELVLVEVPLSNPYQVSTADFERVNGEISFDGVLYKYVKRKITDGKMLLLCIPDHEKMQFIAQKMNLGRQSAGFGATGNKSDQTTTAVLKMLQSEFEQKADYALLTAITPVTTSVAQYSERISSLPVSVPDNPPDPRITGNT